MIRDFPEEAGLNAAPISHPPIRNQRSADFSPLQLLDWGRARKNRTSGPGQLKRNKFRAPKNRRGPRRFAQIVNSARRSRNQSRAAFAICLGKRSDKNETFTNSILTLSSR